MENNDLPKQLTPTSKAVILFLHFFLVVTAYYQVKPASRTLFITHIGSDNFPWIWIASALTLGALLPFYSYLIRTFSADRILAWSSGCFVFCMLFFRLLFINPDPISVALFYITVDIYSVILVEQFWSHASSLHHTSDGKKWYGIIGSGGVVGGIAGSSLANWLIDNHGVSTVDLLLVSGLFLLILILFVPLLKRLGYFTNKSQTAADQDPSLEKSTLKQLFTNRYVALITLLILFSQLLEPIIEFQFMSAIEQNIAELDQRTAFLSSFFVTLGLISLGVNLLVTPLILRLLGAIGGITVQPLAIIGSTIAFFFFPSLFSAGAMKISDRALSYSINRSAKELLYIPLQQETIYRVKAIIDMFGYRLFKIASSLLILLISSFSLSRGEDIFLTVVSIILCAAWIYIVTLVKSEYQQKLKAEKIK